MYTVYGDTQSGNCYKVKLIMHCLSIAYRWRHVDILAGETRLETFLSKNPNARIPVLELEDGRCLTESNAILNYLAHDTALLPGESYQRAQVLSWQFFEQYSHEPYIAVARFIEKYLGLPADRKSEYESKKSGGYKALAVMETRLRAHDWLVDCGFSIADISLYAYTHVCHEGGFSLEGYPGVRRWLGRVKAAPGYVDMA